MRLLSLIAAVFFAALCLLSIARVLSAFCFANAALLSFVISPFCFMVFICAICALYAFSYMLMIAYIGAI